ncbi:hypothetical protein CHU92_00535 [Flavobacterium cyanobacteriorum]|uniref:LVIVD repeat-containing protein n=1 Tax=Flavobacterium cyanobacteriorum TaxID=2022802 RepID=A0A256A5Q6_9FLAO|nr:hypothetical protein [Flavobacterium cyanobacteriorum]OYQ48939.1 hypothetical protein CHU92_00535 [Flavobacterium cyanobacteriorum]
MRYLKILLVTAPLWCLWSCFSFSYNDDDNNRLSSRFQAVVMERTAFENAVSIMPAMPVQKAGKIYVYGNYLFVNDVNKGFHIYNYSNPSSPQPLGFLAAPGSTDMAIRDNIFFINQATDLVTLAYNTDSNTITITKRNRNVFPAMRSPDEFDGQVTDSQVIVDWQPL